MQRKLCIILTVLFVLPGLLMTVSCSKKVVKGDMGVGADGLADMDRHGSPTTGYGADDDDAEARRRALEEERLAREREAAARMSRDAGMAGAGTGTGTGSLSNEAFINDDVYFSFDSSVLSPMAQEVLRRKAQWLKMNSGSSVLIEGHCDERGTSEYNFALGERRAQSARTFLINLGISAYRLDTVSYGEERPLDSGRNESAWARNRRAHFVIK